MTTRETMITEQVCDRCGRTAEHRQVRGKSRDDAGWAAMGFKTHASGERLLPPNVEKVVPAEFDLCPDCVGELVEWWRKGKKG